MTPAKNEPVRIDYPKRWFLLMAVVIEAIVAWLFFGMWVAPEGAWRTLWLIISPVVGALAFVFLVPPLFTHHLAGEKGLRLKMGLLLDSTVPYAWIKDIRETSVSRGGVRVGIGVRYFGISRVLFVTSSFSNLAKVTLDKEHVMGRLLKRPVVEIVLSATYMPALMNAVRTRAKDPESG
jgi:hypothetical protein